METNINFWFQKQIFLSNIIFKHPFEFHLPILGRYDTKYFQIANFYFRNKQFVVDKFLDVKRIFFSSKTCGEEKELVGIRPYISRQKLGFCQHWQPFQNISFKSSFLFAWSCRNFRCSTKTDKHMFFLFLNHTCQGKFLFFGFCCLWHFRTTQTILFVFFERI